MTAPAVAVRCELLGPNGTTCGCSARPDAATVITGPAGAVLAGSRPSGWTAAEAGLIASGPAADDVLAALRSYAA